LYGSARGAISNGRPYRDSYPETGLEEIIGDLLEADLWIASILAPLLAFFQRGEPVGMYDE
jgi:hypothetical protein